jgi:inosine-uridine nucleoside N-ribohydrolase
VDGNCKTHQGAANALRIFRSNNIEDIPPIYLGEDFPKESHDNWYGLDGFGNQQGLAPIVSVHDVASGMFSEIVTNKTAGQAIVDLTV